MSTATAATATVSPIITVIANMQYSIKIIIIARDFVPKSLYVLYLQY